MNSDFILAVHALVFLNHKANTLTSNVLAENICTNPGRVRRVMANLRSNGLVSAKRGGHFISGYYFHLSPEKVNLRMVADALGARFVSIDWHSGDPRMECRVASGISGVIDDIYDSMNRTCLEGLENVTIKDIDDRLFGNLEATKHE